MLPRSRLPSRATAWEVPRERSSSHRPGRAPSPARPLDRPPPRGRRPPHAVRQRGGRGRRGARLPASQDRRRRRHDDHRPRLPGVPVHRRDRRPVRARRTAAPRPVPPRGLAPRRHPGPGPGRDGRPHGQRRARGGRCPLPARVERAHDARGPARLGSAGRRLGTPPEALAARDGCGAPRLRGPRLPGRRRHGLHPAPTVLVGDPRPHRLGLPRGRDAVPAGRGSAGGPHRAHRPLRLRRAGRRRGRARVAGHTRADRGPGPRHPRDDRARGHAPRRPAPASPARARLRLAIRSAGARLRGRARGGGPSPEHPPRPAPGLPRQQDPRDRALGPPLLGPHRRGVGARLRGGRRPGLPALAPVLRDRRREPARGLPHGPVPAVALRARRHRSTGGTNVYAALGETTGIGLVRSAVFAWLVVRLSGLLRSQGVRVQL